jgi:hypothetical protein
VDRDVYGDGKPDFAGPAGRGPPAHHDAYLPLDDNDDRLRLAAVEQQLHDIDDHNHLDDHDDPCRLASYTDGDPPTGDAELPLLRPAGAAGDGTDNYAGDDAATHLGVVDHHHAGNRGRVTR